MLPQEIRSILGQLSGIPYENLSKAVNCNLHREAELSLMRRPGDLILRHREQGSGGTCFSLTWYLCDFLKQKGYSVYPVLCDRVYGKNTHCCAILEHEGVKYLLDPGYLSFTPLKLDGNAVTSVDTVFNTIEVTPEQTNRFKLNTVYQKENKYRFTLKDVKVPEEEFFRHWEASFLWESLTYPVVTMLKQDAHLYFQKEHLYVRRRSGSEKFHVGPDQLPEMLKRNFGINENLTVKALRVFY